MLGSSIIDVAIGIVFIYFLLSVIASHLNEIIARFMDWRSKDLDRHIRRMLADPNLATKVLNHPLIAGLASKPGRTPSYIPSNTFALAIFEAIAPATGKPAAIDTLQTKLAEMPDSRMKTIVLSMLDSTEWNLNKAQNNLATWFDQSMDRLSGAYRRRLQLLTLFVAVLITLLFGVDTIELANTLYREPGLRAAVAGAAQSAQTQQTTFKEAVSQIQGAGLAIGWGSLPSDASGWATKIAGLLLTALAVSLGAPFWYDLLKNIANLRASGPTPALAQTTEPKK